MCACVRMYVYGWVHMYVHYIQFNCENCLKQSRDRILRFSYVNTHLKRAHVISAITHESHIKCEQMSYAKQQSCWSATTSEIKSLLSREWTIKKDIGPGPLESGRLRPLVFKWMFAIDVAVQTNSTRSNMCVCMFGRVCTAKTQIRKLSRKNVIAGWSTTRVVP